jgi:hypothetical protein
VSRGTGTGTCGGAWSSGGIIPARAGREVVGKGLRGLWGVAGEVGRSRRRSAAAVPGRLPRNFYPANRDWLGLPFRLYIVDLWLWADRQQLDSRYKSPSAISQRHPRSCAFPTARTSLLDSCLSVLSNTSGYN